MFANSYSIRRRCTWSGGLQGSIVPRGASCVTEIRNMLSLLQADRPLFFNARIPPIFFDFERVHLHCRQTPSAVSGKHALRCPADNLGCMQSACLRWDLSVCGRNTVIKECKLPTRPRICAGSLAHSQSFGRCHMRDGHHALRFWGAGESEFLQAKLERRPL